jgi:hypothetical protein
MNNQMQLCDAEDKTLNSLRHNPALPVCSSQIVAARPRSAWKSVAGFLSQAAIGGGLGCYGLMIGISLYYYSNPDDLLMIMIITLPFALVVGALLGLLTGGVTLLVENLIEEKLSTLARMIVTGAIVTLIVFGVFAVYYPASWQLLKSSLLPGAILGLPIGLIAGSRLRLFRILLLGVEEPPAVQSNAVLGATSLSNRFALIGGFALRLVSVVGTLMAVLVLACTWKFQKTDELLVTVFALYYFACTAYITCAVRNRSMIRIVGTALNALLLVLAVLWDPIAAENGQPGPLMVAFLTLSFLWVLFSRKARGLSQPKRGLLPRSILNRNTGEQGR